MRIAADGRVVPPEQSIRSHHLLRGPRWGSPQGPGDQVTAVEGSSDSWGAPPAVEGSSDATVRVGRRSSTRASTIRTFAAFTDTRVGKGPSKHSGNGRPPPTEVTMYDSPYDSEEEVDACIAQEVAIEHEDFVDEILEESPETIQTTSDTSLAISRDSDAISGGGSNANSGGGSSTVDSQQASSRDSDAISGGGSNANSGGGSSTVDSQQANSRDSDANSGGRSSGSDT